MDTIHITMPDGAVREVPLGTTPADIAQQISPRLAKEALVARIGPLNAPAGAPPPGAAPNGEGFLVDLRAPIDQDVRLSILTPKDPEAIQVLRHSAAHLLAAAVLELFPNVKLGIGPPIDTGFFYDFVRDEPFTPEDLERIEKKMRELAAQDIPNERKMIPKPEAIELYRKWDQGFKCELVEERATDPMVSFYTTGKFIDFCRGPHIPSTGRIRAFKLMSVAGAYWKGQEGNPQMQRIYGACFYTQQELDDYLHKLEEAKRRDHRRIGPELDLFSIQEEAGPGLIFWHPKGGLVRKLMEDWLRDELLRRGYDLVYTPHIMRLDLWKTSGHTDFYRENMFGAVEVEKADYQLKPMNCPGHILIYKSRLRSYRELPVRLAELGTVYRYERSGVLRFRLRRNENVRLQPVRRRAFGLGPGASGELRRLGGGLGPLDSRARKYAHQVKCAVQAHDGGSRVLRPENRRQTHRRDWPPVAAHHRAIRFQFARPFRSRIRGRRRK